MIFPTFLNLLIIVILKVKASMLVPLWILQQEDPKMELDVRGCFEEAREGYKRQGTIDRKSLQTVIEPAPVTEEKKIE